MRGSYRNGQEDDGQPRNGRRGHQREGGDDMTIIEHSKTLVYYDGVQVSLARKPVATTTSAP